MSEYGSCISMAEAFNLDKERIKMALKGELMAGEDDSGFVYKKASKEECDAFILSAFDNAVFHCLTCARSGRALEKIMEEHDIKAGEYFHEYMEITQALELEDEKAYPFYYEEGIETDGEI